jgi:GGDEF domain-containing protein
MVQDITEQKMLQFKLEELAANDMLTGLPNRRRGQEFLDSQLALCARLGLTAGPVFHRPGSLQGRQRRTRPPQGR